MAVLDAISTFSGTGSFRATPKGRLCANAQFAGHGAFKATFRGRVYATIQFSGSSSLRAAFRGRVYASANFTGRGTLLASFRGRVYATAQFAGAGLFRITQRSKQDFRNMPASAVNILTFSDADYAMTYQWSIDGTPFDFLNHELQMMVRHISEDIEVFLSLDSSTTGITPGESGIDIYQSLAIGAYDKFDVIITRADLAKIAPGDYVHSLILIRPDGLREDLWRGTLTHAIGPTR